MIPSVGRIVHCILPQGHQNVGGHRAAQITAIYPDEKGNVTEACAVDLRVTLQARERQGSAFSGPEGFIDAEHVFQDVEAKKPGTWHEAERIESPKVESAKPAPKGVPA
jgi:hypothetical protein